MKHLLSLIFLALAGIFLSVPPSAALDLSDTSPKACNLCHATAAKAIGSIADDFVRVGQVDQVAIAPDSIPLAMPTGQASTCEIWRWCLNEDGNTSYRHPSGYTRHRWLASASPHQSPIDPARLEVTRELYHRFGIARHV